MKREIAIEDWNAEGELLFGKDKKNWRFICPCCKHEASIQDWFDLGAKPGEVAFSCVGRRIKGSKQAFDESGQGPCTYAGGGLFRLNPIVVIDSEGRKSELFAFAQSKDSEN